ncbi:MAG TPA: hypothetical protein VFD59_16285 [Nocardioidaceae bacterium]|nr:hypothetical protein [Nocardioidaceae bacterium]
MTEITGPPHPSDCECAEDVGKLVYDTVGDVWYQCEFDERRQMVTWVILPPVDP